MTYRDLFSPALPAPAPTMPGCLVLGDAYAGCEYSSGGVYRYRLWRLWDAAKRLAVFVMLNPSTASHETSDPTMRRCEGFARAPGFGGFVIVNLWAERSTDPDRLLEIGEDHVGPANDLAIESTVRRADVGIVIAAWGRHQVTRIDAHRVARVLEIVRAHRDMHVLRLCGPMKDTPEHPLYLPGDLRPVLWKSQVWSRP